MATRALPGRGRGRNPAAAYAVERVEGAFSHPERMTVDFSNLDASTFNIVQGESGQPFSAHYMEQVDAWYNNKTFTLAFFR